MVAKPIPVDVFTPLPEAWCLCAPGEQLLRSAQPEHALVVRSRDELPPDWQLAIEQLLQLISELRERYGDRVSIRLVDPRSLQGLVSALRHRIRHYPTFIIAGREKVIGLDSAHLEQALRTAGVPRGA